MSNLSAIKHLLLVSLLVTISSSIPLTLRKSLIRKPIDQQEQKPFYLVRFGRLADTSSNTMTMDIAIQNTSFDPEYSCTAKLHFEPNATALRINTIGLLYDDSILLSSSEFQNDSTWITVNVKDCYITRLLDHPSNTIDDDIRKSIFVTNSNDACDGREWCQFNVPLSEENLELPGSEWHLNGTRVESIAENLLLVRFIDTVATFKVRLYSSDSEYKELLSLDNATDIDVITSELTICLIHNPSEETVVTCYRFDNNGDYEFHKSVFYPEHVRLASLITRSYEGLLVARSMDDCLPVEPTDCESVYVSKITESDDASQLKCMDRQLFQCFRNATQLAAYNVSMKSLSTLSFTSLCDYDDHYELTESSCEIITEESTISISPNKLGAPGRDYDSDEKSSLFSFY